MYKVLVFDQSHLGIIETALNDEAESGYRAVHFFDAGARLVIVMELRKAGRPKKVESDEASLGE